jgi:hypothetical protein
MFVEKFGFGKPSGEVPWVAYETGASGYLFRTPTGTLHTDIEVSGFQLFTTKKTPIEACTKATIDYYELTPGGPGIDGVLEARRRAYSEPSGREVRGVLREQNGGPLAGAYIHATAADGSYLTRAKTDEQGAYVLHVPAGPAQLTPTLQGWAIPAAAALADGATSLDLTLPQRSTIDVTAKDAQSQEALPVRVQVIASAAPARAQQITTTTGQTATVTAALEHSVDSTGSMCTDFHIHSAFSADSHDPFDRKVMGAIADGLEIPVSSEHEWILDFQPIIQRLGVTKWAFGFPSSELTTFSYGHFGVVPITPRSELPNNGAVLWAGKKAPEVFRMVAALPEKPVLVVNHPSGGSFGAYFSTALFDRNTAKGSDELWSDEFGAIEVFNADSFDDARDRAAGDWFALLNAGKIKWAVGNSDSHDMRSTYVGYPRTCWKFGHDDPTKLSAEIVRDAVKAGAGVVSGGITMTVEGPGGIGPGGTASAGQYKVVVQTTSWIGAKELEVIVDGVSTQTIPLPASTKAPPGKRHELTVDVQAAQSRPKHWVAFHVRGTGDLAPLHPNKKAYAFSNPIFF